MLIVNTGTRLIQFSPEGECLLSDLESSLLREKLNTNTQSLEHATFLI